MNVREHSAFHPDNDCWLRDMGEHGLFEIDEHDYPGWNTRAAPAEGGVERLVDALRTGIIVSSSIGDVREEAAKMLLKLQSALRTAEAAGMRRAAEIAEAVGRDCTRHDLMGSAATAHGIAAAILAQSPAAK